jgi:hypothetical protein
LKLVAAIRIQLISNQTNTNRTKVFLLNRKALPKGELFIFRAIK